MGLIGLISDAEEHAAGKASAVHYDDSTDLMTIHTRVDVGPTIELNKQQRNNEAKETLIGKHVARVPNAIIHKWLLAGVNFFDDNDWPKVLRLLDSPEFSYLRTGGGRLSRHPDRVYHTGGKASRSSAAEKNIALMRGRNTKPI